MSSPALEAFLATLYTDADARARFFADARGEALRAGLSQADARALSEIDRTGLRMAAASYANKREQHGTWRPSLAETLLRWLSKKRVKNQINPR